MNKAEGIYSALVTPMDAAGRVNLGAVRELVDWQLERGVEGFYCCGSSGEGLLLSLEERMSIAATVLEDVAGRVPVIVHTGTIRTEDAIRLSKHAAASGATAVSMIPPYYYKFSVDEIAAYYEDVIAEVDIPVIIYNIPAYTGVSFNKKNSHRLLSNPRVLGIKHTSMNLFDLERIKEAYPDKVLFNGHDENYLYALSAGAGATIGTTVNFLAPYFLAVRKAFGEGDIAAAQALQSKINAAIEEFVDVGIFPAAKYAMTVLGIDCGKCRKPFAALSEEAEARVRAVVEALLSKQGATREY